MLNKLQLPNQQTVANMILSINISKSNNLNISSFELPSSHARVTSIKFTKQESVSELVSELVTSITNDRTRVR